MIIDQDEKPLPADILAHHGVKGQKWGVTKKSTTADIQDARARVGSQVRAINSQRDRVNLSTGATQKREVKKLHDVEMNFLKNPDRETALKLTKGEKFISGLIAVGIPGVGTAAVGADVAIRAHARKQIRKQIDSL